MMKTKIIAIGSFMLIALLSGCGQTKELSDKDSNIINQLGFDANLILGIRNLTDSAFSITTANSGGHWNFRDSLNYEQFAEKKLTGLKINENQERAIMIVNSLRDQFIQNGYFVYVSESNFGYSPDEITVLKTNDKFDLLRFEGTNGINHNIYVEDIIDRLTVWDKKYGLKFSGVGFDFLQADYVKVPENLHEYAKELYDFCPDIVNQGVASVGELENEIAGTGKLYLWWD